MFHGSTPEYNKDVVLRSLQDPNGVVRIVFATNALGMGVDFRGLNTIIHYGAPRSMEDYFQESGRGGRSGDVACSVVYWKPSDCPIRKDPQSLYHHEQIAVRKYLENTTLCRRVVLLQYFTTGEPKPGEDPSRCCDVCCVSFMNCE